MKCKLSLVALILLTIIIISGVAVYAAAGKMVANQKFPDTEWKGKIGADGYVLVIDNSGEREQVLPSYITDVIDEDASYWVWGNEKGVILPSSNEILGSCWYNSDAFSISIIPKDQAKHLVSLYFIDYDSDTRKITVTMLDAKNDKELDQQVIDAYSEPLVLKYEFEGEIKFTVSHDDGANATLSGIFFN